MTLPVRTEDDYLSIATTEPWQIVADALCYQRSEVPLPEPLEDALTGATMILVSAYLVHSDAMTVEEASSIWDRDFMIHLFADLDNRRFGVGAKFDEGEPENVDVEASGGAAADRLTEFIVDNSVCPTCKGDCFVDAVTEHDQIHPAATGAEGEPLANCPACTPKGET